MGERFKDAAKETNGAAPKANNSSPVRKTTLKVRRVIDINNINIKLGPIILIQ